MSKAEVVTFVAIWLGSFCLVLSFWCYDTYVDGFFQYGQRQICLMTGPAALKYTLAIPLTVVVAFDFGLITFCIIQYVKLLDNRTSVKKKLMIFLSRLMALQTCQWIFGVVFYFSQDTTVRYIFEVLISFEGEFIAVTRYLFGI